MKLHVFGSRLLRKIPALATALVAMIGAQVGSTAFAQDRDPTPVVLYTPELVQMQSPLTLAESYNLSVVSPINALPGVSRSIGFSVTPVGKPAGVSDATAIGYVSFSDPTTGAALNQLIFTGPEQVRTVKVSVNIPASAVPGSYGYKIVTTGWLIDPLLGLLNVGGFINATTTAAQIEYAPPTVDISTPVDASVITVTSLPVDVTIRYTAASIDPTTSPITSTDVDVNGNVATVTSVTGLNTLNTAVTATYRVTSLGEHTVTARATNSGGTATDVTTFVVELDAPKPTVVINTPAPGSTYTYYAGRPALNVPFSFTGSVATGSTITSLSAVMDETTEISFLASGLGTTSATGTTNLPFTTAGEHTIRVVATDVYGRLAVAETNFTVEVINPTPAINITTPTDNQVFTLPSGASTMNVPVSFATTVNTGFVINSVSATINGNTVTGIVTPGLGTSASVTSTVTLPALPAGTHSLVVKGISSGIEVTDSTTFRIVGNTLPPSVVINTPPVNSTYNLVYCGPALQIPLTFTGTSNVTGGVITQVTAKVNSTNLATSATLGTKVVNAASVMTITQPGTYTITVTAKDAYGTATASRTFKVVTVYPRNVSGTVFFDLDRDGNADCAEFGIAGIPVKLVDSAGQTVATTTTDSCGRYKFSGIIPASYTVVPVPYTGLIASTVTSRSITVSSSDVCVPNIGLFLNFPAIRTLKANGYTIGYWKNNIDKAISGKSNGTQVSASTIKCYTTAIGDFALAPFDCISLKTASSTMGSTSSSAKDLLAKQLLASEYNYQNGAYIGGNKNLTFLFLWWGENLLKNSSSCSSSQLIWAKDWFDAYNNSHGGLVAGPQ